MHSVYLRLALYVLSTLFGMIPAAWAGWVIYDPDSYRLIIDVQAVVVAVFAGSGISLGILRQWGVR